MSFQRLELDMQSSEDWPNLSRLVTSGPVVSTSMHLDVEVPSSWTLEIQTAVQRVPAAGPRRQFTVATALSTGVTSSTLPAVIDAMQTSRAQLQEMDFDCSRMVCDPMTN